MRSGLSRQGLLLGSVPLWLALRSGGTGVDTPAVAPPLQIEGESVYWLGAAFMIFLLLYMVWITLQRYRS